jgi:hypothetical protein
MRSFIKIINFFKISYYDGRLIHNPWEYFYNNTGCPESPVTEIMPMFRSKHYFMYEKRSYDTRNEYKFEQPM